MIQKVSMPRHEKESPPLANNKRDNISIKHKVIINKEGKQRTFKSE